MAKRDKKKSPKASFSRIEKESVKFEKPELKSNHFLDKKGSTGSYGEKAFNDLAPTKGKGFRQAKNKKKRGAYKGGAIDTGVHSIKFEVDSE